MVRESRSTFSGSVEVDIGTSGVLHAGETISIGTQTPCYRLEIKIDGNKAVQIKR